MKKNSVFVVFLLMMALIPVLAQGTASMGLGLPNPLHEATREQAEQAAGQLLPALPEDASDIVYSYIDASADDPDSTVIAQAFFVWNGAGCNVRVASATEIKDISGMYYAWTFERSMRIGIYDGLVRLTEDGPAVALWYDLRSGAAHSLSMDADASLEQLMTLCNTMAEWEQEEPPPLPGGEEPDSQILSALGFAEPSDATETAKLLGIGLKLPEGAVRPSYYAYPRSSPHPLIAARYMLDGKECVLFAKRGTEAREPSGIAAAWTKWEITNRNDLQFVMSYNAGEEGLVTWLDPNKGINFCLGLTDQSSAGSLLMMAEQVIDGY